MANSITKNDLTVSPVHCIHSSAIGIDVHANLLVCCWQSHDNPDGELKQEIAHFKASQSELAQCALWCKSRNPQVVLMESTGVFWNSVYYGLIDAGFKMKDVVVVKATQVKGARGRKSDEADAQRLAEYARFGDYKPSFIPPKAVQETRSIARTLQRAKADCASQCNRLHKQFSKCGSRLSSVFTSVKGKSATCIIDSYLNDPREVFEETVRIRSKRLKATAEQILDAFSEISELDRELLININEQYKNCQQYVKKLEALLEKAMASFEELLGRLCEIPGVKRLSAMKIVAETGTDLSSFSNVRAFSSWAGVCPGMNESAGKSYSSRSPKGSKYFKTYLVECAQGLALTKDFTNPLRSKFQALKERRGHNRSVCAIAHKLCRIIYAMIVKGVKYEAVPDNSLAEHRTRRAVRDLKKLGEAGLKAFGKIDIVDMTTGEIMKTVGCRH